MNQAEKEAYLREYSVLKNEGNSVISQQVRKFCVEPVPIAHLNSKLVRVGQLSEKRNQPI